MQFDFSRVKGREKFKKNDWATDPSVQLDIDQPRLDPNAVIASHTPTIAPISQPNLARAWSSGVANSALGKLTVQPLAKLFLSPENQQKFQEFNNYQPQTFGEKALSFTSSNLTDAPLWAAGEAIVGKAISPLLKSAPIVNFASKLPGPLAPIIGGGIKDALTYGSVIAPTETLGRGDGLQGLAQREKQLPAIALGGMALRGVGAGIGKGLELRANRAIGKQVDSLIPELQGNALEDVQNAYRTPSLHDVRQQEYNRIFVQPNILNPKNSLRAENPSQYFGTTQADAEAAFPPRQFNSYKFTTGEQRALDELNQGIQTAQNYIGHNDVLAAYPPGTTIEQAYADVKANTGVDLPKLYENYAAASNLKTSLAPRELSLGRAAGVIPQLKPRETLTPKIELPQPEQAKISLPGPRTWSNADQIQARSGQFNPLGVPKLEPKFGFTNPTEGITKYDVNSPGKNGWTKLGEFDPNENKVMAAEIEKNQTQTAPETLTQQTPAEIKKTGMIQKVRDLIQNSDQWKDKKPLSLQTETWDRNIVDIAGKDEGKAVKEYIFDPIHANEADRTRFINGWSNQIKNLGLSKNERSIVQQVGEGKLNISDVPANIDKQKIIKSVNTFRNFYDQAIEQANKVLVDNGYKPVEKLQNYFPHFDGGDPILKALGLHIDNMELPTDINGLTANFKPGKNWVGNFLHRTGDKTTFDAVEGFDRYIHGVSKVIYHTEDIQKLRTFNRELRLKYSPEEIQKQAESIMSNTGLDKETKDTAIEELLGRSTTQLTNSVADLEEFTNVLAGKKDLADRGDERRFGRQVYGITSAVEGRIAKNMTSINPSTWLTQFIPLTQSLATTNKLAVLKALGETMQDAGKTFYNFARQIGKEKDYSIGRDGFVDRSTFLTNRKGANVLSKGILDKTGDVLTSPMKWIDNFSSQVVTRSKYLEGIQNGMSPQEAMKRADDWSAKLMADRSLGSMPTFFNQKSPLTKLLTMFQLEVNNQIHFMTKDMPREYLSDGKTVKNIARLTSAMTQLMVYSWLYNQAFQVVTGRRPALDPIGMALGFEKDKSNPNLGAKGAVTNLVGNIGQQVPFVGGLLFNGGRIPVSSAVTPLTKLPGNVLDAATNPNGPQQGLKDARTNLLSSGAYIALPFGGSQIKKTVTGYQDLKKGGEFNGGQLKFPVANTPQNQARGLLFGPSTFPEAQKYYDNSLKPLSEKQTTELMKSSNVPQGYDKLMKERALSTIDEKIKSTRKDAKLSQGEKDSLIRALQLKRGAMAQWWSK